MVTGNRKARAQHGRSSSSSASRVPHTITVCPARRIRTALGNSISECAHPTMDGLRQRLLRHTLGTKGPARFFRLRVMGSTPLRLRRFIPIRRPCGTNSTPRLETLQCKIANGNTTWVYRHNLRRSRIFFATRPMCSLSFSLDSMLQFRGKVRTQVWARVRRCRPIPVRAHPGKTLVRHCLDLMRHCLRRCIPRSWTCPAS